MLTIKNLTNSPYPVILADGSKEILPARGVLENVEVHPMHMPLYRSIGYFQLSEMPSVPGVELVGNWVNGKPVSGAKTKSSKDIDPELTKLRKDYQEITGKRAYHGWDAIELQKRIDAVLEA
ncbi:hypothetical protein KUG47_12110 [Falsochrobactrum sp. TDYN1]|uniref:Uncharacterized protein n=1 Tax=Falsochrobactrum tianjinense TaxID=2706015 RepID=A0A949UVN6_9HYPH|nr:hypothetical protein [Falsochrobactrum sp. TDYN1]MBV2144238.1 hypothetical protein [Falsochrobactrum sp. TDYN1]